MTGICLYYGFNVAEMGGKVADFLQKWSAEHPDIGEPGFTYTGGYEEVFGFNLLNNEDGDDDWGTLCTIRLSELSKYKPTKKQKKRMDEVARLVADELDVIPPLMDLFVVAAED